MLAAPPLTSLTVALGIQNITISLVQVGINMVKSVLHRCMNFRLDQEQAMFPLHIGLDENILT